MKQNLFMSRPFFFKLLLRRFLCVTHFTIITMPKEMNCDFPNEKQNTLQNAKLFVCLKQFETTNNKTTLTGIRIRRQNICRSSKSLCSLCSSIWR